MSRVALADRESTPTQLHVSALRGRCRGRRRIRKKSYYKGFPRSQATPDRGDLLRKPPRSGVGVEQAVVSPAATWVSEKVFHWISAYRSNPTGFDVHVLTLFQGCLRPYARLDGKHLFCDTPPENVGAFTGAAATLKPDGGW